LLSWWSLVAKAVEAGVGKTAVVAVVTPKCKNPPRISADGFGRNNSL